MIKLVQDICSLVTAVVFVSMLLLGFTASAASGPEQTAITGVSFSEDFTDAHIPAVFAVGLASGFPTYQVGAITASVQMEFIGLQLKGGWTVAGPYFGAQVRGYPPLPVGVPLYVGVGGGVYGSNQQFHVVVGTHVPITENLRLDFEAGVANVPLLTERTWVPHIAAGISYAIAVDTSTMGDKASNTMGVGTSATVGSCEASEPDVSLVPTTVNQVVADMIQSARATYGSVYTDLSYHYDIVGVDHQDQHAEVTVSFQGSVRERLSGERHSEAGLAGVALTWTGCGWRAGDVWW